MVLPDIKLQVLGCLTLDLSTVPTELRGLRLGVLICVYLKYDNLKLLPPLPLLSKVGLNKLYSKYGEFMSIRRIVVIRVHMLLLAAMVVVVVVMVVVVVVVVVVIVVVVVVVVISRYLCHCLIYVTCSLIDSIGN